MRIILDGMGGDHAPAEIVKGAAATSKLTKHEICVVGDEEQIKRELGKHDHEQKNISIEHASEVITNEDRPVKAIRSKKDSSLVRGLMLVKHGEGDLFLSAGNSGALMTGSLLLLGRIAGIERPALGAVYPLAAKGTVGLLIDAGANSECKAQNLLHFAAMGSIYADKVLGVQNPAVGLINMGAEPGKGTMTLKEAHVLLSKAGEQKLIRFIGNIEARDIPYGMADVMVGDGLTGNIVLKLTEGLGMAIMGLLSEKFTSSTSAKIGAMFLLPKLKELKGLFDYSEYGGAPVLGVQNPVIKIHGASDWRSVQSGILRGIPFVEGNVVAHIEEQIRSMDKIGGVLGGLNTSRKASAEGLTKDGAAEGLTKDGAAEGLPEDGATDADPARIAETATDA